MLHAKTLVVDGAWSSVGSVNFDNRSFQLHDEITLCVQSRSFADVLAEQFERDLAVSEEIDPERWKERGIAEARGRGRAAPRPARAVGVEGRHLGWGARVAAPRDPHGVPNNRSSSQMTKPRFLAAVTAAALLAGGTGTALAQTSGDVTVTVGPRTVLNAGDTAPFDAPGVRAVRRGKPIPSGYQLVGRKVSGGGSGVGAAIRFSCTGNKVLKTFGTVGSVGFSAPRTYENHKSTIVQSILSGSASGTVYAVCR